MKFPAIRAVFPDTIPVLTGYLFLGAGFGILLVESGYSVLWAAVMAILIFAGSGQYLLVGLLASGASLASAAVATLLVNARHLFYGISLVDAYKTAGKRRLYMIFGLTDETYSLICSDSHGEAAENPGRYYFIVTLLNHIYWTSGCFLGGLIGPRIPFNTEGVDFALTALFVTILVEQWQGNRDHRPAIIGIGSSVLCLVVFGAGSFLIPSMVLITVGLCCLRIIERRREDV